MRKRLIGWGVAGVLGLIVGGLGAGYMVMFHMPGKSYREVAPPLDAEKTALRNRLRGHVRMLAHQIGERHYWQPERMHEAAAYIDQVLRKAGYEPFRQIIATQDEMFANVGVRLPGRSLQNEALVIGAHYDTVRGSPGADDNASGVAVLLELARLLRERKPDRTIHLVAFANEEMPFFASDAMGSLNYARQLQMNDEKLLGMISLEMLGYYVDDPGTQFYPPFLEHFYPDTGNFLAFVGNVTSRRLVRQVIGAFRHYAEFPSEGMAAPELIGDIRRSDHWAFWQMGYPAMMLTDTANFRNPYYHSSDDTYETLDYDAMARLTAALAQAMEEMARE